MPGIYSIGDIVEYPVQWPGFIQYRKGMIASDEYMLANRFGESHSAYDILTEDGNKLIMEFSMNIIRRGK